MFIVLCICRFVFRAWCHRAQQHHIKHKRYTLAASWLRQRRLRYCLHRWHSQQQLQARHRAITTQVQHQHALRMLKAWRGAVSRAQQQQKKVRQLQQRLLLRLLLQWRAVAARQQRLRDMSEQLQQRRLRRWLQRWREWAGEKAAGSSKWHAAVLHSRRGLLGRMVRRWAGPMRGRKLLVRVFAAAAEAWQERLWEKGQMQGEWR